MLIRVMHNCKHCDINKANIFDCLDIHGDILPECVRNTWGHE